MRAAIMRETAQCLKSRKRSDVRPAGRSFQLEVAACADESFQLVTAAWGPNHFTLRDGGAVCGLCQAKNPLGNLRKISIQEVTTPAGIIVCLGPGGHAGRPGTTITNALHIDALHIDCKTVLGPRIPFASAETLEKSPSVPGRDGRADRRPSTRHASMETRQYSRQAGAEQKERAQDRLQQTVIWLDRCQLCAHQVGSIDGDPGRTTGRLDRRYAALPGLLGAVQ